MLTQIVVSRLLRRGQIVEQFNFNSSGPAIDHTQGSRRRWSYVDDPIIYKRTAVVDLYVNGLSITEVGNSHFPAQAVFCESE